MFSFSIIRFYTLLWKEVFRFLKVWSQTVLSPVMIAVMYFAVFGGALSSRIDEVSGVSYLAFIVPGLAILQSTTNAFQNPSSSIIISRYHGIIADLLITPLSAIEKTLAFILGGVVRGIMVAGVIYIVAAFFIDDFIPSHPFLLVVILILVNFFFSALGVLAGLWSKTFDQISGIGTFIITPMGFLGGVFYSIEMLPQTAQTLSHFNPFLYFVDLSRWAFFGVSEISVSLSFSILLGLTLTSFIACFIAFSKDYGLKE